MEEALEAFLSGKNVERKTISGGTTNGRTRMLDERPNYVEDEVPEKTRKYAERFMEALRQGVWSVSI